MNHFEKTMECYEQCIKIAQQENRMNTMGKTYENMGIVEFKLGIMDKALNYQLQRLCLAERTFDIVEQAKESCAEIYKVHYVLQNVEKKQMNLKILIESISKIIGRSL